MSSTSGHDTDLRPGRFAWGVIVVGWALVAVALVGVFDELRGAESGSWARWVLGAALVHDLIVLPLVLVVGWALSRLTPLPWRVPLRTALVMAAVVSLTVFPVTRRWGARSDNPSILPLPAAQNLALVVAALLTCALVAGAVTTWRGAPQQPGRPIDEEDPVA